MPVRALRDAFDGDALHAVRTSELADDRARCPIRRLATQLQADGTLDGRGPFAQLERDAASDAEARARAFADAAPYPDASELLRDVV